MGGSWHLNRDAIAWLPMEDFITNYHAADVGPAHLFICHTRKTTSELGVCLHSLNELLGTTAKQFTQEWRYILSLNNSHALDKTNKR
jgi:hypothetical protein